MWTEYVWIVVIGALLAFFTAYGIGANDVANAFATSVGAKALTLTQAVIVAGIFEFLGALLLGSNVTDTVRKNIADVDAFVQDPEVLMYGMMCVLASTGLWLLVASYLELPVSTTHSVIGGIVGMALAAKGKDAVVWAEYDESKEFLSKFKGVVPVIVSWITSPLFSAILAMSLFLFVRHVILRSEYPKERAFIFFPILVGATVAVNIYFVIYKGFKREFGDENKELYEILGPRYSSLIAWVIGIIAGIIVWFFVIPHLKTKINKFEQEQNINFDGEPVETKVTQNQIPESSSSSTRRWATALDKDLHKVIDEDKNVHRVHKASEKFDKSAEEVFKYLQVFTAICDSFAHGANDVANSIGPFAAIYSIYKYEHSEENAKVPEWILALGGFGIVIGLSTYGYNIIRAIGIKLVTITASRGFSIELGAAVIIILASRYGMPLSTTHCQVGATVGVGILEGKSGINLILLIKVIGGWIITLIVVGFTTAALFAQGAFAPSLINIDSIHRFEDGVYNATLELNDYNIANFNDKNITENLVNLTKIYTDTSEDYIGYLEEQVNIITNSE